MPTKYHYPERWAWKDMKDRCYNSKNRCYSSYGGRGIRVCSEWRSNFLAFLTCVGRKPGSGFSLDRIDNNGNYEPGNVRWATKEQQYNNTSRSRFIEAFGKRQTVKQWAAEMGLKKFTLWSRIFRCGWAIETALTEPVDSSKWHNGRAGK